MKELKRRIFDLRSKAFADHDHVSEINSFNRRDLFKNSQVMRSSHEHLQGQQTKLLADLLQYAVHEVPFYRNLGISLTDNPFKDIQNFPIISKDIINSEKSLFLSENIAAKNRLPSSTSGSTGRPFEFYVDKGSTAFENLTMFSVWNVFCEYELGDPILTLRSYAPDKNQSLYYHDTINNFHYLSPFHINSDNLQYYLSMIKKSKAKIIRGYPTSIALLAKQFKQAGIRLEQFKYAVTSSETLSGAQSEEISSIFGATLIDWYGLNERVAINVKCKHGNYHNLDTYGYCEVGSQGELISTSLHNRAMPLIRYNTGDIVETANCYGPCACGNSNSVIFSKISGRQDDYLIKADGTPVPTVNFYTAFYKFKEVLEYQVVQNLDLTLTFYLVTNNIITKDIENAIKSELELRLGSLKCQLKIVESIPRDPITGKVKAFKRLRDVNKFVNTSVVDVKPYIVSSHKAWLLNENVIKLDWNEFPYPPSDIVKASLAEITSEKKLNWYPNTDHNILTEKLGDYYGVASENILITASSDAAHELIAKTYMNPSSSALLFPPTYDNFRMTCELTGASIEKYPRIIGSEFSVEEISKAIKGSNSNIVYLVTPDNPTGFEISKDELRFLAESNKDKLFIIDQAYIEYAKKHYEIKNLLSENVIITRTFSKAYGLAALRGGAIIASKRNIESLKKSFNPKSVSTPLHLALAAVLDDIDYYKEKINKILEVKEEFKRFLSQKKVKYLSGGGNFILLVMDEEEKAHDVKKFLEDKNIFTRQIHEKGWGNCLRITIGTEAEMKIVMACLNEYFQ